MPPVFEQSEIDTYVQTRLERSRSSPDCDSSRLERRYRDQIATMVTLVPALDYLSNLEGSVWALIGVDIGPGPYPIGPLVVEKPCYCSSCRRFMLCQRTLRTRTMQTYKTRAVAQSVGTRFARTDGCRYVPIRLPQRVLDTTSALLVSGTRLQQEAFSTAVLLCV